MRLNRDLSKIKSRKIEAGEAVETSVRKILEDVRLNKDAAIRGYAARFDGFTGENLFVGKDEISSAERNVGDDFMRILHRAAEQIREFHASQKDKSWAIYKDNGVVMGQIVRPLQRVALYTPAKRSNAYHLSRAE